jgi:hypothetical protein
MKKIILGGLLGVVLVFAGIFVFYNYLEGLKTTNNIILLIASIALFAPGIYILFKSGSTNAYGVNLDPVESEGKKAAKLIEKNSKLAQDWKKTVEQADKLRLIGIRADQENKN